MFDINRLKQNKLKTSKSIESSKLHSLIIEDILDRLEPIDKSYNNILIINNNFELLQAKLKETFPSSSISYFQYPDDPTALYSLTDVLPAQAGIQQNIHFEEDSNHVTGSRIRRSLNARWSGMTQKAKKFDLIIFPFGMHWITDVQQLLANSRKLLEPNGILMCNFLGGGSLQKLRRLLLQLEMDHACAHTPHLSPLIQFEHVTPLLQQAGFVENIIDMEAFELEYKSPLELMRAIKNSGESNALLGRGGYSISKAMYNSLTSMPNDNFVDHLNLITFLSSPTKQSVKLKAEYFNPGPRT